MRECTRRFGGDLACVGRRGRLITKAPHPTLYEVFFVKRKICVVSGPGRRVGGPLEARSCPSKPWRRKNVAGWTLVKAEAAGGGGRRPAFTRVWPATTIGGRGRWAEITPISRLIFRPSHAREDKGRRSSTSRAPSSRRTWACAPSLSGGFSTDNEARLSCGLAPDDDVRGPRSGHRFGEAKIARGTVPRAPNHRATTLYSAGLATRTHDALMRIGGVVPRRRDHSLPRREGHGWVRVAAASDRCPARADTRSSREEETPFQSAKSGGSRGVCRDPVFDVPAHALESNNSTPTGTVPPSTKRHKSINNLRASATIIVLRTPRGPLAVRASNHLASALSFWNIKNRQASWIMPRRTRALPDRANPFSRLREPLSSGEPVRPP